MLARARRLQQVVLKRAFDGRLVEQDSDAGLAGVLLERIAAHRAAVGRQAEVKQRKCAVIDIV